MWEYKDGAILVYTTSASSVLLSQFITTDKLPVSLGTVVTGQNFGIKSVNCKEVTVSAGVFQPVCILTQDSNTLLDITFSVTEVDDVPVLKVDKTNLLNYFDEYQPVYIDFEEDIIAVKGRIYDNNGEATKEAMLFYVRNPELTSDLYWGLNPEQYLTEWTEGDITTPSIPVTVVTFEGDVKSVFMRFTQLQTIAPEPTSSSEDPSSSEEPGPSEKKNKDTYFMNMLGLRAEPQTGGVKKTSSRNDKEGGFRAFKTALATITISQPEIYQTDADQIKFIFNSGLGQAAQTSVPISDFYETVEPTPSSGESSGSESSGSESSGSESSGSTPEEEGLPWWVWVIIGLIVFLIIVGILLYFLTKNKEEEEENDEYMTPDENKKFTDEEE